MAAPFKSDEEEYPPDVPQHRAPFSEDEAREILESIRQEKGHVDKEKAEDMAKVGKRTRQFYDNMARNYRKEQAKSTLKCVDLERTMYQDLTLDRTAEELYSTKFRLIYELLQNADDAQHRATQPRLIFTIYPNRLVVDSNEEGFTIENVRAICRTGESSKPGLREGKAIGEKGYGFKSVFAIANHVRIQSVNWSFYFEHHEGQDGMGMITPLELPPETLSDGMTTRITLTFRPGPEDIFLQLVEEMEALPNTVTLFLQNIQKLDFKIENASGAKTSTTIDAFIEDDYFNTGKIIVTTRTTTSTRGEETITKEDSNRFILFESEVINMPTEKRRKGVDSSTVQIAFPIKSDEFRPKLDAQGQYIFAFLPMHKVAQLPFTMQADFVTLASRESIVRCEWNQKLFKELVKTFALAIETFYDDEDMRYVWMEYLPGVQIDGFWQPIRQKVEELLAGKKILETWSGSAAYISDLKIVPKQYIHGEEPLLHDLEDEIYLSPKYEAKEIATLRELGVKTMTQADFLRRLQHDLIQPNPCIRTKTTTDIWHESLSSVLIEIWDAPKQVELHKDIEGLELIPLRKELEVGVDLEHFNGENMPIWVSAAATREYDVYFPHSALEIFPGDYSNTMDCFPIPVGIDSSFKIVWPPAVLGTQRKELLARLGVIDGEPDNVVAAILDFHQVCYEQKLPPSLGTIVPHLQYLFRFYNYDEPLHEYYVHLVTDCLSRMELEEEHTIYFKSDGEFSAWNLLNETPDDSRDDYANFIHDDISNAETTQVVCRSRSWRHWLQESLRIKTFPPLHDSATETSLSPVLRYVLEHRPAKFLPLLSAHWESQYKDELRETPDSKTTIAKTPVLCTNGRRHELCETYLPSKSLNDEALRIGIDQELPILEINIDSATSDTRKWDFLLVFGVRSQIGLRFYIRALDIIADFDPDQRPILSLVSKVYTSIGSMCNLEMQDELMKAFSTHNRIYNSDSWESLDACVWEAPSFLTTKYPLASVYKDQPAVSTLFRTHLELRDAYYQDYLDQLILWKQNEPDSSIMLPDCIGVYREFLKDKDIDDRDWDDIREEFEDQNLILVGGSWYAPSRCLWSSGIAISDKVTIADTYTELEALFVEQLGVQTANITMVIDELIKRANTRNALTTDEAKTIMQAVARMMHTDTIRDRSCFQRLMRTRFLPISVDAKEAILADGSADFVIADHERFYETFGPITTFLDFSLEEVQVLRPLIEALGLTSRYLSRNVEEASELPKNLEQNDELTGELQSKAYSFYCCAIKYKSSKVIGHNESLYNRLSSAQVLQTDGMRTSMILTQSGKSIVAPSKRVQLKSEDMTQTYGLGTDNESGSKPQGIRISVPADVNERKICYRSQLPGAILSLLGIEDSQGLLPITRLLNLQNESLGEAAVLAEHDIPLVSWLEPPESFYYTPASPTHFGPVSETIDGLKTPQTDLTSNTPSEPILDENLQLSRDLYVRSSSNRSGGSHNTHYRQLLGFIIAQVARTHQPPESGTIVRWDVNSWVNALPDIEVPRLFSKDEIFGVRSEDQLAHDMRIGAAGELFVYETLCRIDGAGFSLRNWESSIRHLVRPHPEYADIAQNTRTERADMVYQDTHGLLADWLQQQRNLYGVLDMRDEDEGEQPTRTFFIEVKTTVKSRDEVFHMSRPQYQRMLDMRNTPQDVYVIFRVYNLLSDEIDMDIYLSPLSSDGNGDKMLRFASKGYWVKPVR